MVKPIEIDTTNRTGRDRALFDEIAASYAQKDTLAAPRAARQLRLRQTIDLVGLPDDASLLEVGCGAGYASEYLKGRYRRYLGIDHSEKLIEFAMAHFGDQDVRFVASDLNEVEISELFDAAFMVGLLHHLEDPVSSLKSMKKMVRPGGWVIANEPQSGNRLVSLMRGVRKRVDTHYSDEQAEFSRAELETMFAQAGFTTVIIKAQGVFSTPFAEVLLKPGAISAPLSHLACGIDRAIEKTAAPLLQGLSWNLIVAGEV